MGYDTSNNCINSHAQDTLALRALRWSLIWF